MGRESEIEEERSFEYTFWVVLVMNRMPGQSYLYCLYFIILYKLNQIHKFIYLFFCNSFSSFLSFVYFTWELRASTSAFLRSFFLLSSPSSLWSAYLSASLQVTLRCHLKVATWALSESESHVHFLCLHLVPIDIFDTLQPMQIPNLYTLKMSEKPNKLLARIT